MTEAARPIAATMAHRRPRKPDLAAENEALHTLARQPIDDPQSALETAVEIAMNLCRADSVGIGLFETLPDGTKVFRWVALCGALASVAQTIAHRNLNPSDTAIHDSGPQLYARPDQYFTYLHHRQFPIFEGMQLPLCADNRLLGTFWLLSHHEQRQFDRTDERLMVSIAGFAAAALQRSIAAKPDTATIRPGFDTATVEILESITDAVVCLDGEWRITYVNQAVVRMNNLQLEEMIGKTHWEIWPWSVGTIVEQTYRQVVADRVAAHFEVLYEPLKMWLEIHAYPAPAGLSIYFRDITDRKQTELLLVEQKRLLELTASGRPLDECVSALCASMSQLNSDVRACVLLADSRRQTFPRSIAPDLAPSFGQGLKDAPINDLAIGTCGEAVYCNRPVTCADIARDDRWSQPWRDLCVAHGVLACHSAPIRGADRLPLASLMLCFGEARMPTDWEYRLAEFGTHIASIALERDRQSQALRESEAKYRTLAEFSTHHVWMLDTAGEPIFLNQTLLDYFGKSLSELKRENWADNAHHPDDRDRVIQEIDRAIAAGINIRSEHRLRRHDGRFRWFLHEATPLRDANGEITHWLGVSVDIDDSKQAADALRQMSGELQQQVQKFDAIASSIPDFIYTFDLSGRFTYINPPLLELWQKTEAEALGKNFFELDFPPDLATKLLAQIRQVIETGQPVRDESPYTSAFGTRTYEYIFFLLANSASGAPEAVAGVTRDITDRQLAQAALRDSEEKFRNMADNAPFMVWVTDPAGYCHYLSQSWYDFTGQTPETGLGFGWLNATHPDDRESAQQTFLAANDRQEAFRLEYRLRRSDGEYIWAIDAATPWFGVEGEFKGYIGSVIDIDDRKKAESALRRSEERYRTLFESMDEAFCVIEVLFDDRDRAIDYRFLEVNPAFEKQTGLQQAVGKTARQLVPNLEAHWIETYAKIVRTGEHIRFENRAAAVNRWFDVYAFRIGPPQSRKVGVLFKDISDRKRIEVEREQLLQREQAAREAAENANRIKDEFLAVLSHELRSPLNPILGWSRLLQTGKLDASKTASALATIERNAKLQASLIEDLLDVSRILQGKLRLNVTAVNLASTIQAAIETVRLAAEAKSIEVELHTDPNVRSVSGDATRLQQVLWNLLSNAVKFTHSGGRVEIRLRQEGDRAQITIRDNGKGIPKDFLPYVFDYFRQADSATTRKFGGLGLGLAIVRHLVELHGGTVASDSLGEGLGATFTVTLPLQAIGVALGGVEQFSESSPNLQGVRVLVVDDDTDSRNFQVFVLEEAGASVTEVASAGEAFAALTRLQPDILLSDIGMPDLDGYTLIRQVRTLPPDRGGQIPAIALTAYAGEFNQKQALAAGFQCHLTKPIEPNQLVGAIVTLLGKLPP